MPKTIRDALSFVLLGTLAPVLFIGVTGNPEVLATWLLLFVATTFLPRN